jgi:hypothetical protein
MPVTSRSRRNLGPDDLHIRQHVSSSKCRGSTCKKQQPNADIMSHPDDGEAAVTELVLLDLSESCNAVRHNRIQCGPVTEESMPKTGSHGSSRFERRYCAFRCSLGGQKNRPAADFQSEGSCGICIEDFEASQTAVVLPCKHFFHSDCGIHWLKMHNTYPLCRVAVDSEKL